MASDPLPSTTSTSVDDERPAAASGEHERDAAGDRPRGRRPWPDRAVGALAGLVAAAAALAAGELAVGLVGSRSAPSLVSAVGTEFIDRFAARLKDLAVSLFGRNDKVALIIGIVVTSLLLGAVLGALSVRRRWVGVAGFVAFGVVGLWCYARNPLASPTTGAISATVAVAAGVGSLLGLLRLTATPSERSTAAPVAETDTPASPVDSDGDELGAVDGVLVDGRVVAAPRSPIDVRYTARRTFLVAAGLVTAAAAGAAALGRRFAAGSASEDARSSVHLPRPDKTDAPGSSAGASSSGSDSTSAESVSTPGLSRYVTPNAEFYRIDTALTFPQVDLDSWRLGVGGMVDRPLELSYDDLLAMESVAETVTLSCVSNEVGGDLVGNAVWQGVPLAAILERAGVQRGAGQIVGRSLDDFTAGFPTEHATDGRVALVAYGMNGEPLPVAHGFPARVVVAGLYGYVSATKWLSDLTLTTWDGFDGYWIPRGWSKEGPIKTQSRIDVPRGGQQLDPGSRPIAGVAWAPTRGIERVEVRVDGGAWRRCALGDPTSDSTWVQWRADWDATPGRHVITVRATDGDGHTQTSDVSRPDPNGATGWHSRTVTVRD